MESRTLKSSLLHIGTEKTGATTIQEFLRINRKALLAMNIHMPDFLGIGNHQWLPNLFQEDSFDESFFQRLDIGDLE